MLTGDDIGVAAWKHAKVTTIDRNKQISVHYRVDVLWYLISQIKFVGTTINRLKYLPQIVSIVLVIPHRNAGQERLFSIVRKNKTDSRSSLKLYRTLAGILSMKKNYPEEITPCFHWKPDELLLDKSRDAAYNDKRK